MCEAELPEERELVRAGIERDQQLAIAVQAVPEERIREVAGAEVNPIADLVLVRQRLVLTPVPLEETHVSVSLVTNGRAHGGRVLDMSDVLVRTGESIPAPRTVTGTRSRMSGGEFLLRLGLGIVTVGLSEIFIRSSGVGSSGSEAYSYVERPSESEIRAAAPEASAITTAARGSEIDRFLVFDRPAESRGRALAVHVTYEGSDERYARCTLEEHLVVPLEDDVAIEEAIARRFGARELTLADLRAMASD